MKMAKPRNDREIQVPDNPPAGVSQVAEAGSGRTAVRLELRNQGRDLLLMVTRGRGPCRGRGGRLAPMVTELVVVPGHKEGPLAAECAEAVARAAGRTCAAVAGIHQDHATEKEIAVHRGQCATGLGDHHPAGFSRRLPTDRMNHEQP